MKIREVFITATNLDAAADFYRDVLELPVDATPDRVRIDIGTSRLILTPGEPFAGSHHLAFGISPHDFETARDWLRPRVQLLQANGSDIIEGPAGWDSRSLYFYGPEGIVLELIARSADAETPAGDGRVPRMLSISEIGLGVPDVTAAVHALQKSFALPQFPPQLPQFAPIGNHDGLLILADLNRIWFPTTTDNPAHAPLAAHIELPNHHGKLTLTPHIDLEAIQG